MVTFQKKNPILIGGISVAVITLFLLVAFNTDRLPGIGSGPQYQAEFAETAGLVPGNEVRIAGVRVGKVTSVALQGSHVEVLFRAKNADIGDQSSASIQIKTLLGNKYLAIDPAGDKPLTGPIPLERTVAPFDVVQAFQNLSTTVQDLNTDQLAASLTTLSQTFQNTPDEVRGSLEGLSRLSVTIASRNDKIEHLLGNTAKTTNLLAARNEDIDRILADGTQLLDELRYRENATSRLLDGVRRLSSQLHGLIKDNDGQIGHTLRQLDQFTDLLQKHRDDLGQGIRQLGPFVTVFANSLGSGRWFDSYIDGLIPLPVPGAASTNAASPTVPTGGQR
ncbi:MAG TPA: MCE family protein [Pseudonocardia sp.]|jgi:phospholipid/cholesterol/gamma-HCH transport system substrate-binding protein